VLGDLAQFAHWAVVVVDEEEEGSTVGSWVEVASTLGDEVGSAIVGGGVLDM
jgi:hypothetical protein